MTEKVGTPKQLLYTVIILILVVVIGVCVFLKYYSAYIDSILYAERLNQMHDVSVQLFSGLEDALENHWAAAGHRANFCFRKSLQRRMSLRSYEKAVQRKLHRAFKTRFYCGRYKTV